MFFNVSLIFILSTPSGRGTTQRRDASPRMIVFNVLG